jgi:hypothetical protein
MRADSQQSGRGRKELRPKLRLNWAHGACFVLGLGVALCLHLNLYSWKQRIELVGLRRKGH